MRFLLASFVLLLATMAFAQPDNRLATGADLRSVQADPPKADNVPSGGCMPIGLTARGDLVFPMQCRELIERERGPIQDAKPQISEPRPQQDQPLKVSSTPLEKQEPLAQSATPADVTGAISPAVIGPATAVPARDRRKKLSRAERDRLKKPGAPVAPETRQVTGSTTRF